MSLHLSIIEPSGERVFNEDQLPVTFGSAASVDVRIPGPAGGGAFMQIDQLDGTWFVQVIDASAAIKYNEQALSASRRIGSGDRIELFGSLLACQLEDGSLSLSVDWGSSSYRTAAPVEEAAAGDSAGEEILAAQFRRSRERAAKPEASRGNWRFIVGIAVGLLASLAWLLFTSKSVGFETVPASPDRIAVMGGWFKLPLGNRYLLRPGDYRVLLQTEGYYDLEQSFAAGDDAPGMLRLQQRPLPGTVHLFGDPLTIAEVTFDGEVIGNTPITVSGIEPGKYTLRFEGERYLPWEGMIEVEGLGKEQSIVAQLVPAFGRVRIISEPPGAGVFSGPEDLGRTPAVVEIAEGRQSINLILDGYKPADIDVSIMADTETELAPVILEKADGMLSVRTRPSGANVTVDGKYRGQSPVRVALAPGQKYLIGLSKAGYGKTTRSVRLKAAEGQVLDVDLAARYGEIELAIAPADATIFVNGRQQPAGTAKLRLPASPQRIEVRRSGYETWKKTITPRPGYPQRVSVRLRTADQVRVAGIKQTLNTSQGQVLRYVNPGSFRMGASRREPGRRANETLRNVKLTRAFYIGTREITNREFSMFRQNHDSGADLAAALAGDKNPVVNLSWQDAAAFCNWLSEKEGLTPVYEEKFGALAPIRPTPDGYRLPTEAEWAWAARYQGGSGYLKFPWGDAMPPSDESGNYADAAAKTLVPTYLPNYDDGFAATAPVASFKANAIGVHDFGGNAAEWIHDYYEVYTPDSARVWTDPEGPQQAKHNVIRGSSWRHAGVTELRLSFRDFGSQPRVDVGFRIARSSP